MREKDYRLDVLFSQVLSFRTSENFRYFMDEIAALPLISPYNAMLVHMQRPGSRYVATAERWKTMGAKIREGANPLIILRPFGPVEFVYEESDIVEGTRPKELSLPFEVRSGTVPAGWLWRLEKNLYGCGIKVSYVEKGVGLAGYTKSCDDKAPLKYYYGKNVYSIRQINDIVINSNLGEAARYATLLHEAAHIFCGHLGTYGGKLKIPDRGKGPSLAGREFEAESVCWLVCKRSGIDNPSEKYLAEYLAQNNEIPNDISVETVLCVAGRLESYAKALQPPIKAAIIKKEKIE